MSPDQRMSAEQRREQVLAAATAAFAQGGYEGTSTEDVAERAGISQPYIFRLFGSKRELFVAVVERCFQRINQTLESAARGLSGKDALQAMGMAYIELIRDPSLLQVELHAFTASVQDAEVRRAAHKGMRTIWEMAARVPGVGTGPLRAWLADGMLCNVMAALSLEQLDEPWARQVSLWTDHGHDRLSLQEKMPSSSASEGPRP